MPLFKSVTQGGQVNLHQLHMLKQVLMAALLVAFVGGGGFFAWKGWADIPASDWRQLYENYWARFMLMTTPDTKHRELKQLYVPPRGRPYERSVISVLKDPLVRLTTRRVEAFIEITAYQSIVVGVLSLGIVLGIWFFIGNRQKQAKNSRGIHLVPWKELAKILKRKRISSDLKLGKLPLLKQEETSHILITGTTGSGKTNSFHLLLPQIRKRRNKALIVDLTGSYVSRYYNPKTDLLLNPLDQRSSAWHPWADCHLDSHYDVLAESLIQPKEGNRDPFWDNAARSLLKTALRKSAAYENYDIEVLYAFLTSASDEVFEAYFEGTEAAISASRKGERMTYSIRNVLSTQIEGLRYLESPKQAKDGDDTNQQTAFSVREWIADEKAQGWLFITARADQRKALIPLISTWFDIALNALMVMPEDEERRVWFLVDELAALQKLPSLQMGLAEIRKYGGCIVTGFQTRAQLEDIYGKNAAETMMDLFNTKIFFRCMDPATQQWVSKVLGEREEEEATENISFGANSLRDGVSLGRHTRQKAIVLPTELSLLEKGECYIKYPGNLPCTKIQTPYQRAPLIKTAAFLLKPEKKPPALGILQIARPVHEDSSHEKATSCIST